MKTKSDIISLIKIEIFDLSVVLKSKNGYNFLLKGFQNDRSRVSRYQIKILQGNHE